MVPGEEGHLLRTETQGNRVPTLLSRGEGVQGGSPARQGGAQISGEAVDLSLVSLQPCTWNHHCMQDGGTEDEMLSPSAISPGNR